MKQYKAHKQDSALKRRIALVMRNMAIRQKIVLVIMFTSIITLILAGIIVVSYQYIHSRREMVKKLQTQADMIAFNCAGALSFEDQADATDVLRSFKVEPSIVYACVYDINGHLFAKYCQNGVQLSVSLLEAQPLEGYHFSDDYLTVSKAIKQENEVLGTVSVWSDLEPIKAVFRRNILIILGVITLAALVAYLLSYRVQGVISGPILDLADVAKSVSEKNEYSTRAVKVGNDEVGQLIDSFNDMLEQIQQRDAALVGANEKLEARVEERTAELKASNEKLTQEMDYRRSVEAAERDRTERIIRHQTTLLKLGKMTEVDLSSAFRVITEEVGRTLNVERVSVWLLEKQEKALVCQDLYKLHEGQHEEGVRLAVANFRKYMQAMEASRIVAADDALRDPRTIEFAQGYLQENNIMSMMDVPIRFHGKLIGVLCHEHINDPREWTLEEQDFVASIADMIANKLEAVERRKAQLALRESEHRYRTLLTNIPQKIFYKDLNAEYLLCNKSYSDDLGIEPDQIKGKTDFDFHPSELAAKYRADDKRIISTGEAEEIEEEYRHGDEELIVRTLKSPVRDEEGNIIGIFGIFWDITARKQAEDALAQLNKDLQTTVEELQRSNKELQDFAYVTAHDLKSPLRAIGTLTDWIYVDYEDKFDDQGREQMRLIKGRVSRMNELIDSILRYAEIGRGLRHLQEVPLQTLVAEVIHMIDVPDNITIDIVDPLPTVICEKPRIIQVFHNLVHNAIRFMDKPEGHITIGCTEQEHMWTFRVTDNGPGIDPKYHEKIFRMFQTLTPRDELESTGIGLAVIKKIVEIHGGKVWLESICGEGTTFLFTLPKQSEAVKNKLLMSSLSV